jgi:hypothetical protein
MNCSEGIPHNAGRGARACGSRPARKWLAEGWRLLRALLLLLEIDVRLRLGGFARVREALRPRPDAMTTAPPERILHEVQRVVRALGRASRLVPGAHCLHRALALQLWLRRRGFAAELCLAVRCNGKAVEGHAWLEWHGIVLDAQPALCATFARLEKG